MSINKKVISLSVILVLLTAYILPGTYLNKFSYEYGYPLRFLRISTNAINSGDTIANAISIYLINLIFNVIIIYLILKKIYLIYKKLYRT